MTFAQLDAWKFAGQIASGRIHCKQEHRHGLEFYRPLIGPCNHWGALHAGVPRVFDRIYNGVITKIEEKGGIAAKLFHWGYSLKSKKLKRNVRNDKVPGLA